MKEQVASETTNPLQSAETIFLMGNKEVKTGSKQTMSACCSQPIHLPHRVSCGGILKIAA